MPERYRGMQLFGSCTLEPVWYAGRTEKCVDYHFHNYFENKNLGFTSVQLGQENSMVDFFELDDLRMQLAKAQELVKD